MEITARLKINAFLDGFLTKDATSEDRRRLALLIGLSTIGFLFLIAFGITAFVQNNSVLGVLDIVMAVLLLVNVVDAKRYKRLNINIHVGIVFISFFYIYLFVNGGIGGTAFVWYFTYPLIASYLLGSFRGGIYSGLMLIPIITMIVVKPQNPFFINYSLNFHGRFIAAYIVVAVFSYLFEQTRESNREEINAINQSLEGLVEEKTAALISANANLRKEVENRRKANESILLSQKTLITILDSINATIYVADMETYEVLFMNEHMRKSLGRDKTGELCWQAIGNHSGPCEDCSNPRLVIGQKPVLDIYVWEKWNPVTGKWHMNYDRAITWTDGRIVKIQIAFDISERKQTEKILQQSQKMESIGTLAGGIAHDFNNILAGMIGYTELALHDVQDMPPTKKKLDRILEAGGRATELVKQILSFSRSQERKTAPVSPYLITKEVLKLLRASLPATIEIKQSLNSKSTVMADETNIHQVLMNLCTNAGYAMKDFGGTLTVKLEDVVLSEKEVAQFEGMQPGAFLKISVEDTGCGIPEDIRDRIFDPFFTTKTLGEGTGMGLAAIHGIVNQTGGTMDFHSEVGKGSVFNVFLPTIVEDADAGASDSKAALIGGTERILFVDDEKIQAEIALKSLGHMGYRVKTFCDAVSALKHFQQNPNAYDLIITDMTMPKMTGDVLTKKVRETRPDIPVIICTGFSDKIDKSTSEKINISGLLYKPVILKKLLATIREALDENRMVRQQ